MSDFVTTLPIAEIARFCQRWNIEELAVFGSVLRDDFGPDSDVDIIVAFAADADWGLLDHVKMQQELQAILQRDVDLITKRALEKSQNWLRRNEILKTARHLFPQREALYETG